MNQKMAWLAISGNRDPLVLQTLYASVQGDARAKKWEQVGRGARVEGVGKALGDLRDSIWNVNEENT